MNTFENECKWVELAHGLINLDEYCGVLFCNHIDTNTTNIGGGNKFTTSLIHTNTNNTLELDYDDAESQLRDYNKIKNIIFAHREKTREKNTERTEKEKIINKTFYNNTEHIYKEKEKEKNEKNEKIEKKFEDAIQEYNNLKKEYFEKENILKSVLNNSLNTNNNELSLTLNNKTNTSVSTSNSNSFKFNN